jgi:predicted nucleotidyltransferase
MVAVSTNRAIDPQRLDLLRQISRIAAETDCTFFVAGAFARDILLTGVFGIETGRATLDVDVGVVVKDWPTFASLKTRFLATKLFSADSRKQHRLMHLPTRLPLDLIPFGGLEGPDTHIAWPPDQAFVMNVAGYKEALESAVEVQVAADLSIRVASLPGLSILKVFAWEDRGAEDPKDAIDLGTIMRKYGDAGNQARVYEDLKLLELMNYEVDLVGTRLLGRDAGRIASPDTKKKVLRVLADKKKLDRLALDIARSKRGAEDAYEEAVKLIAEFRHGIEEA